MRLRDWREQNIIRQQKLRADVAQLTAMGKSVPQVAKILGVSQPTVRRCREASEALGVIVSQARRDRLHAFRPLQHLNERARMAAELRVQGHGYDEIAAHIGVSVDEVHKLIRDELDRQIGTEVADIELARMLDLERLDEALNAIWEGVIEGNRIAIETMLKLQQARAKLLGLDAPIRIDIEQQVRRQAAEMGLDPESAVLEVQEILRAAKI